MENLDAMSLEEIEATRYVFDKLRLYCLHKGRAMRLRLDGDIRNAQVAETQCEMLYETLPQWAKW